jgi:multicomponent Na+:H+ antiporter subunit B
MKGMTIIVKTISSWIKVLVFLFGIYIILFGHLTPGGGFSGGVIIAASYVLLLLAFGREYAEKNLSLPIASRLDCVAAFLFAALASFGFIYGAGFFFYNFLQQKFMADWGTAGRLISAGAIPLSNIFIGIKVAVSLFMVILVLSAFRLENVPTEGQE